ncbi:MAG: c-type cytochrome [Myxococcota bacterium]|nr:c-type cytochrome [Myxococcota bacterium]
MRTLWTSRHFSSASPPPGDETADLVEDANEDSGTPSFLFLGFLVAGVLLLAWLVAPRVALRLPVGEYTPAVDRAVDVYEVVDADKGIYRVPVAKTMAKVAADPALLGPIAPAGGFVEVDTSTPEGQGQALFAEITCNACHTIDGSALVGPTLQGIFGRSEKMADGSELVVDDAYLVESILEPNAKIVEGFKPSMILPRQPTEDEVALLLAYLKTL